MKKIILFCLLVPFQVMAQSPYEDITEISRNHLMTGAGIAFTGTEAMWGYSMFTEYNYYLNKNISISSGLAVMHFWDDSPKVMKNAQVESLELGINFHLLPDEKVSFHMGGGGNLRFFHWGIATSPTGTYDFNGLFISTGDKKAVNQFTAGYTISAGFGIPISGKTRMVFREQLQNDKKKNATWDSRIALVFKL